MICHGEGSGFFPGLFVKGGLAKLLREGPGVRVRVTVARARSRRPDTHSQGFQPAQQCALGHLLLALHQEQGAASCDTLVPPAADSPPYPTPPQGSGPGHRRHRSTRGPSADLHYERLPLRQGEDIAVWLPEGCGVGVKLTACPPNSSGWWLLEQWSRGGRRFALWGAGQS